MRGVFIVALLMMVQLGAEVLQNTPASFSKGVQKHLLTLLKKNTYPQPLHVNNTYTLHKGWNLLRTPKEGIDVIESFKNIPEVKFVVTYDFKSRYWAGFTLKQSVLKDIKEMLLLRYLEPGVAFFILSDAELAMRVSAIEMSATCKEIFQSPDVVLVRDSGLKQGGTWSKNKDVMVESRYLSHFQRGYYDDTRVVLGYKKRNPAHTLKNYGPVEPYIFTRYDASQSEQPFYVYDYFTKKCYGGVFPSKRIPPVPVLKVLE